MGGGDLNDDRKPWIDVIQFAIKELKEGKDEERKGCWMTAVKSLQLMIIVVASWMVGLLCSLSNTKAELLQLNRTQFSSLGIFFSKKLEIEKTKTTFIISVLKVEY